MNIAELFVRVRGDVSDVAPKLQLVEGGLQRVGAASVASTRNMDAWGALNAEASGHVGEHSLSIGRLERALSGMTEKIAGVNPVVGLLTTSLLKFGIGTVETVAALGVLATAAFVFDKLTEGARKAEEAGDKLTESYAKAAHVMELGIGGKFKADIETLTTSLEANIDATNRWSRLAGIFKNGLGGALFQHLAQGSAAGALGNTDAIAQARQQALNEQGLQDARDNDAGKALRDKQAAEAKKRAEEAKRRQEAAARIAEQIAKYDADLEHNWQALIGKTNFSTVANTGGAARDRNQGVVDGITSSTKLSVSEAVGASKVVVEELRKDATASERRHNEQVTAVWGAAITGANAIVNALNIGGGGKGSQLGGAIGSAVGTGAGAVIAGSFGLPPQAGSAVGALLGNIAGSLFGGLFDSHKKSVDSNTRALQLLTATLLNAPSGFSVSRYRYSATQVAEDLRWRASRGGSNIVAAA